MAHQYEHLHQRQTPPPALLHDALSIFEATPDPYLVLNTDLTIAAVNNAYLHATSTFREEIIGRGIFDVFPDNPEDPNATGVTNLRASLNQVIETKRPHRMAIQKYDIPIAGTTNFKEHYWSPLNTPVLNEQHELLYIIHHVEDVTEMVKKKMQAAELEMNEARFRQIANAMPQQVWTVLPDGTVNWCNDWWYSFTGLPRNFKQFEWLNFIHPDDQESFKILRNETIKNQSFYSKEIRIRDSGGVFRWHLATIRPVRDENKNLIEWVGVASDIHDLTLAKEKIQEDEARFRTITNAVPQIVWSTRPDGYHDYFNERYYEFTGAPRGTMFGDDWIVFHHPDDRERLKKLWKHSLDTGELYEIEYRMWHHSGEWRWILARALPIRNKDGKIIRWFGTCTDIHDQRKTQEALEESEAKFRTITNALPQIVWSTLPDGNHDYFNDRFYEYTGLPYGSISGEKWIDLVHPEDQERLWQVWRKCLATGERYEIEYRIRFKTGEYRWILARALPIRNKEGKIIRWFGTSTDIHEQILTQTKLNEAIRDREMFFSIASHELKSPLTALSLQAQMILRKLKVGGLSAINEEDLKLTMEKIQKQTLRLVKLVDEMLDVSRITSGKLTLELAPCDLCEMIREVLTRMTPQFQKAGVPVPELEMCKETRGNWDHLKIEQVITNLLTNALRYGNGKPITIRLENFESYARFSVEDKGIGIAEESKDKIFDRFERATTTSKSQGLGLGLYITKEFVLAHKGKIWVDSELGKGSVFFVELPKRL